MYTLYTLYTKLIAEIWKHRDIVIKSYSQKNWLEKNLQVIQIYFKNRTKVNGKIMTLLFVNIAG